MSNAWLLRHNYSSSFFGHHKTTTRASDRFGAWNNTYHEHGGIDAVPVPADYDGDGKADLSVKTSDGKWHIDYASN